MPDLLTLRDAVAADLPDLLQIYNYEVRTGTALWSETPVDLENRAAFLEQRQAAGLPVTVAEYDGQFAGYATYGPFRPHEGYRFCVEHSVYVRRDMHRRRIGKTLLGSVIHTARANGYRAMIGAIGADNPGSIALHQNAGFQEVGRLPQIGFKFGRRLDLVLMQLLLDRP